MSRQRQPTEQVDQRNMQGDNDILENFILSRASRQIDSQIDMGGRHRRHYPEQNNMLMYRGKEWKRTLERLIGWLLAVNVEKVAVGGEQCRFITLICGKRWARDGGKGRTDGQVANQWIIVQFKESSFAVWHGNWGTERTCWGRGRHWYCYWYRTTLLDAMCQLNWGGGREEQQQQHQSSKECHEQVALRM